MGWFPFENVLVNVVIKCLVIISHDRTVVEHMDMKIQSAALLRNVQDYWRDCSKRNTHILSDTDILSIYLIIPKLWYKESWPDHKQWVYWITQNASPYVFFIYGTLWGACLLIVVGHQQAQWWPNWDMGSALTHWGWENSVHLQTAFQIHFLLFHRNWFSSVQWIASLQALVHTASTFRCQVIISTNVYMSHSAPMP